MKETKEARAERHARELWNFVEVLRRAGNVVDEEVRFDSREPDPTQAPPIPRKWRFDLAMPLCNTVHDFTGCDVENIAIEIEGYGRHQSMKGFTDDLAKYSEAFAQGWTLLRVSRQMIADGTALDILARRGVNVTNVRGKTFPVSSQEHRDCGRTFPVESK